MPFSKERRDNDIMLILFKNQIGSKLSNAMVILKRLKKGKRIKEGEIDFLIDTIENLKKTLPVFKNDRKYQHSISKVSQLYENIAKTAFENEEIALENEKPEC